MMQKSSDAKASSDCIYSDEVECTDTTNAMKFLIKNTQSTFT